MRTVPGVLLLALLASQAISGVLAVTVSSSSTQVGPGSSVSSSVGSPSTGDITSVAGSNQTAVQGAVLPTVAPIVAPVPATIPGAAPTPEILEPGVTPLNFTLPNATVAAQALPGFYLRNSALNASPACVQSCAINSTCGSRETENDFFGPDAVLAACTPQVSYFVYENMSLFDGAAEHCLALKIHEDLFNHYYFAGNIYTERADQCDFTTFVNWILTDEGQLQSQYDLGLCATVCTDLTAECATAGGYNGTASLNVYGSPCVAGSANQKFEVVPISAAA